MGGKTSCPGETNTRKHDPDDILTAAGDFPGGTDEANPSSRGGAGGFSTEYLIPGGLVGLGFNRTNGEGGVGRCRFAKNSLDGSRKNECKLFGYSVTGTQYCLPLHG